MSDRDKAAVVAQEKVEVAEALEAGHASLRGWIERVEKLDRRGDASPELILSMRRTQEALFWLQEHDHAGRYGS